MRFEKRSPRDAVVAQSGQRRRWDDAASVTFHADFLKSDASTRFEGAIVDFPRWGAWAASLPGKLWSRVLCELDIRRKTAELEAFDDRALRDIGLSRCEIDLAVRHGRHWLRAPGPPPARSRRPFP